MRFIPVLLLLGFVILPPASRAGLVDGLEAYDAGRYDDAYAALSPLAQAGEAQAQYVVGEMFMRGRGISRDYEEAVKWYARAAGQGLADAQAALGGMYEFGSGVERNITKAADLYAQAARQGHADAARNREALVNRGLAQPLTLSKQPDLPAEPPGAGIPVNPPGLAPPAAPPEVVEPAVVPESRPTPRPEPPPPGEYHLPALPRFSGALWEKPSDVTVSLATEVPPLQLEVPDPGQAVAALPLADISAAMEGLRVLAGPLDPGQEKAWAERWQPYFDFPAPEAVEYFKAFNPLIQELHGIRGVVQQAALDFDGAWSEAVLSNVLGDEAGAAAALAQANHHQVVMQSANSRLDALQKKAQELGNPPNPHEARARAKAWCDKWRGPGAGTPLARAAYLWRISQCGSINIDAQFYANMGKANNPEAKDEHQDIWPADEETWTRWFNGGETGEEPRGGEPAKALHEEASAFVEKWFDKTGADAFACVGFFQKSSPRAAAERIVKGQKVVPTDVPRAADQKDQPPTPPPDPEKKPEPPTPPAEELARLEAARVEAARVEAERVEAERKDKEESIKEKEDLLKLIRNNLARDEEEWKRETDPERKDDLYLRVMNNQSAILHEQDLIRALKTGEYTRTRTPADEYCHDLMITRALEEMARVGEARRLAAAVEKMAARAEPDQVPQLKDFVARQITSEELARGDVEKIRKVAKAVFDTTQGRQEQNAAQHEEEALQNEDYELRAQRVKSVAGVALLVTAIGAPAYAAGAGSLAEVGGASAQTYTYLSSTFGAFTGGLEGGALEAVKQGIAMTGVPGMVAAETMTGYQRGGLVTSGGVAGALERGAEAFLVGKLVESAAGRLGAYYADKAKSGAVGAIPKPTTTVESLVNSQQIQTARAGAQKEIQAYQSLSKELAEARAAGASAERLAQLEAARVQKALELNENFMAKRILKAEGAKARALSGSSAAAAQAEEEIRDAIDTVYRTRVDPIFNKYVKDAGLQWRKRTKGGDGWEDAGPLEFREFRQDTAARTVNTDRDLGLIERKTESGVFYQLFKGGKPINTATAEKELQILYDKAYQHAGGADPRLAMQHITTSSSAESYRDELVANLVNSKNIVNPENIRLIKKNGCAEQTAEVLQHKIAHAGPGTGEYAELFKKIDGANQAVKDIEQRVLPVLRDIKGKASGAKAQALQQDIEKWEKIRGALAEMEVDPAAASRNLKVLTGMDSIGQVGEWVGKAFVGAVKLN